MDSLISISMINDFLYCPKSIYLHNIYSTFEVNIFHELPQIRGSITHSAIDKSKYSTSKNILQGISVYSEKLGLKGKIDLYNIKEKKLIERKYKVKEVYQGFKYQLYAQMYCLNEVGLDVKQLCIHSLSDNKNYFLELPDINEYNDFLDTITKINTFSETDLYKHSCLHCQNNIYGLLNW